MEVDAIGSVSASAGRVAVFAPVDHAKKVAVETHAETLRQKGVENNIANSVATATQPTSEAYTPAVYAQAAQYALYTQAGVLAGMIGNQHLAPDKPSQSPPNTVKAVDNVQGSKVDTRA